MKILFAASEMAPLARSGGLGDVINAFPAALARRGHEVSVILPCYRGLREHPKLSVRSTGVQIEVQIGSRRLPAEVLECEAPNGMQVFLVRQDEFFDRSGLYGASGQAYGDNAERFIFFSKAVVELARRIVPPPEIVHAHDWQTALVPVLVRDRKLPFKTVLTIHNLAYQGSFWGVDFGLTNLPGSYFAASGIEFYGQMNLLKGGILFADAITTVSGRYAREILTAEQGCSLDAVLRENASKLTGVLNGVDYEVWNPATDKLLPKRFDWKNPGGKRACRDALLAEFRLAPKPKGPVFAMVSRLAEQKGIDLVLPLLDRLLSDDVRLVILGEGDTAFERELLIASRRHPERFAFAKSMDERLAHLIYAGADAFLIPSHFEPCGLSALYSLKYGTVPIARATGGLHETIRDYDPMSDAGNGILFYDYQPDALWDAILRAKRHFEDGPHWLLLMQRGMQSDFSWETAVTKYEAIYDGLLGAAAV